MDKVNVKQVFLITILLIFWGTFSSISKLLLNGYDSISLLFFMYLSSAAAITVYMTATRKIKRIARMSRREIILYSLISLFSFLYYLLYFLALKQAPAIEITTINYLFPILIALLSVPINKEKFSFKTAISLFLGFTGVIIIVSGGNLSTISFTNIKADILIFLGALFWSFLSTFSKRIVKDQENFTFIAIIVQFLTCIVILPFFTKITLPDLTQFLGVTWLGVSNLVICFLIWLHLVSTLKTSTVASIAFLTPFVNLIAIVLILGEKLTIAGLVGFIVIVLGIVFQQMRPVKMRKLQ
ncbi:MAG: DMT family transporter [Clostridia bacterium]|nr:DMT family transporter [Clostridia bacterium]